MRGRALALASTLLPLVALLPACSSSGDGHADAANGTPMSAHGIVCASAAAKQGSAKIPTGFPSDFPFPPGTIITSTEDRGSAGIIVTAVSDKPFQQTLASLNTSMKSGGYTIGDSESEPHDAEAEWTTADYEGRWALREATGCDNDTAIQVVASKK